MTESIGYIALKKMYNLPDIPHHVASYIVAGARKTVNDKEYYPHIYRPENTLAGHLEFALKFEGVNLGILAELFSVAPQEELIAYIQSKPTGVNTRRIWFYYEFLTGHRLDIPDTTSTIGYVDALDTKTYITNTGKRLTRYHVRNNLLGDVAFCPIVRRTENLKKYAWETLRDRASKIISDYDAETLARAINYLYTKETRSSFAIEHEEPSQSKMERFGSALQGVRKLPTLDKQAFIDLQFIMIDERFASEDYRDEQNYVGETVGRREIYHFISPKHEDVPQLMDGLLHLLELGKDIDPIVLAAMVSFGFVFIHPFDDGNGRTHRYMIHHILANRGVSPEGVIFPVSATMLNNVHQYDACLESFSKSIMPLIDFVSNDEASIEVLNETINLYRYFDATRMAEYLYECIDTTIDKQLKTELDTISAFSKARKAIDARFDLPEKKKNLFLKLCWDGKGQISKNKRKSQFEMFSDKELDHMESLVAPYFSVLNGGEDEST
ncbi:MAG: Fic family protein [Mariprofundaceae bacterium]